MPVQSYESPPKSSAKPWTIQHMGKAEILPVEYTDGEGNKQVALLIAFGKVGTTGRPNVVLLADPEQMKEQMKELRPELRTQAQDMYMAMDQSAPAEAPPSIDFGDIGTPPQEARGVVDIMATKV